jgi:hypothetical protein
MKYNTSGLTLSRFGLVDDLCGLQRVPSLAFRACAQSMIDLFGLLSPNLHKRRDAGQTPNSLIR